MDMDYIRTATRARAPHFFSRATLQFFGQTFRSFKCKQSPTGRWFIYAPAYDGARPMGYTFSEFVESEGALKVPTCDDGSLYQAKTLKQINDYIKQS